MNDPSRPLAERVADARFWAERARYKLDKYLLDGIVGPDVLARASAWLSYLERELEKLQKRL